MGRSSRHLIRWSSLACFLTAIVAHDTGLVANQPNRGERAMSQRDDISSITKGELQEVGNVLGKALELLQSDKQRLRAISTDEDALEVASTTQEELLGPPLKAEKPLCSPDNFPQMEHLRGRWRPHRDPEYKGLYIPEDQCPRHNMDWQCHAEGLRIEDRGELLQKEYAQEWHPEACTLRPFDAAHMSRSLGNRRLIMIGDSLMRQQFYSLGCLLAKETVETGAWEWEDASHYPVQDEYIKFWREGYNISVHKQLLADFNTSSGLKVSLRSFGLLQQDLWDDVIQEFLPFQPDDILMVNYGAWYPRFKWHEHDTPWANWQQDMNWLLQERLRTYPCKVIWREYTPTHFGGYTGTFTGIEESLPSLPAKDSCPAATVGEFWYDEWMRQELSKCGPDCSHIHLLPIYQLSLTRADSHFGSFGRGVAEAVRDCRHFCQNVVDVWNVVLFNKLC